MPWKDETDKDVKALFTRVHDLGVTEKVACRGVADRDRPLITSLDRILDSKLDYRERLAEERAIIEKFKIRAKEYLSYIEERFLFYGKQPSIAGLAVLQHYGAPTRLLDWTYSPWVALYFAAINHPERDGAVWWFNHESFEKEVGERWKKEIYDMDKYRKPPDNEVYLEATAFDPDGPPWITGHHYLIKFHRLEVQQGHFTVAGRLGEDHGERIADIFDNRLTAPLIQIERQYSRIIIPAKWKQEVLNRLRIMNIHAKSLDYPGADHVGKSLTSELKKVYNGSDKD